ncbi:MAG TPA: ATP-binding protein [Rectinema sp.]|nr:ATP-binding protein [Rectinema sp.]
MKAAYENTLKRIDRIPPEGLKQIVRNLLAENSIYESALNSTLDGIIVCDLAHKPLFINRSAEKITRIVSWAQEVVLWEQLDDDNLADFIQEALSSEKNILNHELSISRPGGTRLLSISISALVSEGKIAGNLIHIEDITEKRRREAQLRRAESLAALTTLAAGVAHEIKNPLASIRIQLGIIRRILEKNCAKKTEPIFHNISLVEQEIDRLNSIVVDFLFAVRPMDITLIRNRVEDVIKEVVEIMGNEASAHHINIVSEFEDNLPEVMIDPKHLKQALLNIVKNAIAAMPNGGTLTISAVTRHDELQISISDTGIGIPEELLAKIFEPYFTTKESGTGLGLTITFKIIKEHNGEITVESKPSKGSTFTIHLPIPQPEQKSLPPWEDGLQIEGSEREE